MSSRVQAFADRLVELQGGASRPIFLVRSTISGGDSSRGERGTVSNRERELIPRPTAEPVSGELITRMSKVLKVGDVLIEIPGTQLSELDLRDSNVRFRVGLPPDAEILRVVTYERMDLAGEVMYYRVFCRGVTEV